MNLLDITNQLVSIYRNFDGSEEQKERLGDVIIELKKARNKYVEKGAVTVRW